MYFVEGSVQPDKFPDIPTTMFSSANPESVRRNIRWHEETADPALLASVRELLAPVFNQQWEY